MHVETGPVILSNCDEHHQVSGELTPLRLDPVTHRRNHPKLQEPGTRDIVGGPIQTAIGQSARPLDWKLRGRPGSPVNCGGDELGRPGGQSIVMKKTAGSAH